MRNFLAISLFILALIQNAVAMNSRNLTILAEPNMVLPLTKIARIYSQQSNVITSLNFEPATDLVAEIDAGEPADLFISAHAPSIENLKQKGLIDVYNIGYIARDELVLVTSKNNNNVPPELIGGNIAFNEALKILENQKVSLIIDDINKSSGKFALDALDVGAFKNFNLVKKGKEERKSIIKFIKNNEGTYALLLKSQVAKDADLQIIAVKKDSNIFYQALVIAGDSMEVAREFMKFLKGAKAKEILREEGFIIS